MYYVLFQEEDDARSGVFHKADGPDQGPYATFREAVELMADLVRTNQSWKVYIMVEQVTTAPDDWQNRF